MKYTVALMIVIFSVLLFTSAAYFLYHEQGTRVGRNIISTPSPEDKIPETETQRVGRGIVIKM